MSSANGLLDYPNSEFVTYYNTARSHMEHDHLPPIREVPVEVETLTMDQIEVKSYVGGRAGQVIRAEGGVARGVEFLPCGTFTANSA